MKHKINHTTNRKNQLIGLLLFVGLVGTTYEAYQTHKISKVNRALLAGEIVNDENYPFHKKFADAYQQGKTGNFKIAVQGFGQLLEAPKKQQEHVFEVSSAQKSKIQFNIANNLFRTGLQRLVGTDGTIHEDALYAFQQAKSAYEQSLKLDPTLQAAKFNFSLLLSVIPTNLKAVAKEQSGMEISNLPQGLP
jgi:mxaK protein